MCRLVAFHADRTQPAAGLLVDDPHALVTQSCGDRRGESHGDGWGIGHFADGTPQIVRGLPPAGEDPRFREAARAIQTKTLIGHVRQASVGSLSLENTHPFGWGSWIFAHNGTIQAFDAVSPRLIAETDADLLAQRRGTTDSELVFYWLFSGLRRLAIADDRRLGDLPALVRFLADSIQRLAGWCEEAGADEPARMNFVFSDGRSLVASRWRHSLQWRAQPGQVSVASEPTNSDAWQELPDASILTVDERLAATIHSI